MAVYEVGKFIFLSSEQEKTINLNNSYSNQLVIKLTPQNSNVNLYLSDVQNNYFTVKKNSNEEVNVNYIVIESES